MDLKTFLALVGQGRKENYFVICSDQLGLQMLLPKTLDKICAKEDVHFLDAETITTEKARQLEEEARKAPIGMSNHTYFVIYGMQRLPYQAAGPLLKVTEESKYAAYIFQGQTIPDRIRTILSRSMAIQLPFMSRRAVLGNMQTLHHDARAADELNLYDGTLAGTIRATAMKDMINQIRRDLKRGARGVVTLATDETTASPAYLPAIEHFLTEEERLFLRREDNPDRRKLIIAFLSLRTGQ